MPQVLVKPESLRETSGLVHCPICTHTVEVQVLLGRRYQMVKPDQKCPRCASCLDAGVVLGQQRAA